MNGPKFVGRDGGHSDGASVKEAEDGAHERTGAPVPKKGKVPDALQVVGFALVVCWATWSAVMSVQGAAGDWMAPSPGRLPMPMWTTFALACGLAVMSALAVVGVTADMVRQRRARRAQKETQS